MYANVVGRMRNNLLQMVSIHGCVCVSSGCDCADNLTLH